MKISEIWNEYNVTVMKWYNVRNWYVWWRKYHYKYEGDWPMKYYKLWMRNEVTGSNESDDNMMIMAVIYQ